MWYIHPMEVYFLGHSAFRIEGNRTTVIIDPFDPEFVGLPWKKQEADIVCVTHDHRDHSFFQGVKEGFFLVNGPGEYEIKKVNITGIPAFHDKRQGRDRGPMTLYLIQLEEFNIAHFGNLGHLLTDELLDDFQEVDVLILPIGGKSCLDATEAAQVVAQIEPRIVIPSHYDVEGLKLEGFAPLSKFLEEMGESDGREVEVLKLKNRSVLPEDTEVVVMRPKLN